MPISCAMTASTFRSPIRFCARRQAREPLAFMLPRHSAIVIGFGAWPMILRGLALISRMPRGRSGRIRIRRRLRRLTRRCLSAWGLWSASSAIPSQRKLFKCSAAWDARFRIAPLLRIRRAAATLVRLLTDRSTGAYCRLKVADYLILL